MTCSSSAGAACACARCACSSWSSTASTRSWSSVPAACRRAPASSRIRRGRSPISLNGASCAASGTSASRAANTCCSSTVSRSPLRWAPCSSLSVTRRSPSSRCDSSRCRCGAIHCGVSASTCACSRARSTSTPPGAPPSRRAARPQAAIWAATTAPSCIPLRMPVISLRSPGGGHRRAPAPCGASRSPSTRERNCARSVALSIAITASSFWPVKYVLKNSDARHAKPALQQLAHGRGRVGDRLFAAVEIQLGHRQAAHDAVPMPAQLEVELDAHRRPWRGAGEADRVLAPSRGVAAVERPRHGLEDGRLSGAVRSDDARQPGIELDFGVGVLAEVDETEAVEPHTSSTDAASPRAGPACSASRR